MIKGVDHIAIAVENLDEAVALYEQTLGLKVTHREYVADFDVETATIVLGDTAIELLEGKSAKSAIRRFVENTGPGLHHIALTVDDIHATMAHLRSQGAVLIDEKPRVGKEGSLVAFIHPRSTGRVLYELVQPAEKS